MGFPGGSNGKESAYNSGNPGSIPGSRKSPVEGNGNPLQYPYLENPMEEPGGPHSPGGCKESNKSVQPSLSLSFAFFP